ncbi:MAG: Putative heat shock protein YegD, partial [uncultured Thiotrichaceae bacterium]
MSFCGLDFGTSNSTIGISKQQNIEMVALDGDNSILRSAIFLDEEELQMHFGESAIEHYIEGSEGRLMTSIKSVLGSSLMDQKTRVFNEMKSYSDVLGYFIKHMKNTAETSSGDTIDSVVLGRPVRFNDRDDEADQLAEDTLREIAQQQGFKHIEFQFEPIAAAMAYEQTVEKEELALIVDIGGGTSDFTLIKITPKDAKTPSEILATAGVHIGGTNLDKQLSYNAVMPHLGLHTSMRTISGTDIEIPRSYYSDLCTWHKINLLYARESLIQIKAALNAANDKQRTNRLISVLENRDGHRLLEKVENAKKQLTNQNSSFIPLDFIESQLQVELTKDNFETIIDNDLQNIYQGIEGLVKDAGINNSDVNAVFFTGGTSQIGKIQNDIMSTFKNAKKVTGNTFGSVGHGLVLDAVKRFS